MRLLVTGGCGFIGSAFCRRIMKQFHYFTLVNIDNLYPCSTIARDLTVSHENYTFVHGNITDAKLVRDTLEKYDIDTIIHFAAQSHVDTSFTNPLLYTHDNVLGTHTLLEVMRQYGKIKRFIHISTDEVYGENGTDDGPKTENSLLKPTNPYAATKAGAEMLVHSYIHSYNLPAIIVRSNNIYGPGQYPEKVVPKFIMQLLGLKKLTIQGSGKQLRSFLHVEDAVDAILCILFQGENSEIYNISSKDEISILELAKRLIHIVKSFDNFMGVSDSSNEIKLEHYITFIEDRNFNDKRYWIKSEPLEKLGWKQNITLDKGLVDVFNWYRQSRAAQYWVGDDDKRAIIWGGKGWIGGLFSKILEKRGWTVTMAMSRADDRCAILEEIGAARPTHIVSLIGRTHGPGFTTIDYLEQPGKLDENMRDNFYGPVTLASVAKEKGLHMLYMGTGCIFEYDADMHRLEDGEKGHGFKEDDLPNFFGSAYSTVKGYTDRVMHTQFPDVLNVRIRMPISSIDGPRNFISKIIQYPRICSIPNSMTVMDDILPLLAECMEKRVGGTLNATNPGLIDHSTVLDMYRRVQNSDHTWEEITNSELVGACVKGARSNNFLDTGRIESLFPGRVPHIRDSVMNILANNVFAGRL